MYQAAEPYGSSPISPRQLTTMPCCPMGPPPPLPAGHQYTSVTILVPKDLPEPFRTNPFLRLPDPLVGLGHPKYRPYVPLSVASSARRSRRRRRFRLRSRALQPHVLTRSKRFPSMLCSLASQTSATKHNEILARLSNASSVSTTSDLKSETNVSECTLLRASPEICQLTRSAGALTSNQIKHPWFCASLPDTTATRSVSLPPSRPFKYQGLPRSHSANLAVFTPRVPEFTHSFNVTSSTRFVEPSLRSSDAQPGSPMESLPPVFATSTVKKQESSISERNLTDCRADLCFLPLSSHAVPENVSAAPVVTTFNAALPHPRKTAHHDKHLAALVIERLAQDSRILQQKRMQLLVGKRCIPAMSSLTTTPSPRESDISPVYYPSSTSIEKKRNCIDQTRRRQIQRCSQVLSRTLSSRPWRTAQTQRPARKLGVPRVKDYLRQRKAGVSVTSATGPLTTRSHFYRHNACVSNNNRFTSLQPLDAQPVPASSFQKADRSRNGIKKQPNVSSKKCNITSPSRWPRSTNLRFAAREGNYFTASRRPPHFGNKLKDVKSHDFKSPDPKLLRDVRQAAALVVATVNRSY